jgi:hypothetical protein
VAFPTLFFYFAEKDTTMIDAPISSGADIFIAIFIMLASFGAGLAAIDLLKAYGPRIHKKGTEQDH